MPNLTPEQKNAILNWYRAETLSFQGHLQEGRAALVSGVYNCSTRTVGLLIHKWKAEGNNQNSIPNSMNKRIGRHSGTSKLTAAVRAAILQVSQQYLDDSLFCTDRRLRCGMIAKGHVYCLKTIQKWKKLMGGVVRKTYLKPALTDEQKAARVTFVNQQIDAGGAHFKSPNNLVHVDETWYYLDRDCQKSLLFPGQVLPAVRRVQHKSHITKVMMICAVGYPHQRPDGTWFNGRIGRWSCTVITPARRNSVNRPAGTPVTTAESMTADKYVDFYTRAGGIMDKIRALLPHLKDTGIRVQHDGAKPHTGLNAEARINACLGANNWNCTVFRQPAQSPDLNVLDLGLFHGMKSSADGIKGTGRNINTCIERMNLAFDTYPRDSISAVYGCLFQVYRLIRAGGGGNGYKVPHSGVRARGRLNGNFVNRNVFV